MSEKERESSVIHPSANAHLGKKCQRKVGEEGRQCESSTQVRRIDLTSRGGDREGEQLISQWVSRRWERAGGWCEDGGSLRLRGRKGDFLDCDVTGWRTRLQSWLPRPAWSLSCQWCYYTLSQAVSQTVWAVTELLVCSLFDIINQNWAGETKDKRVSKFIQTEQLSGKKKKPPCCNF